MRILKIESNKPATLVDIEGSLKSLQEVVGGYIEAIYPFSEEIALVCNEEGKIENLAPTLALAQDGKIYDIICGTCFMVGLGTEDFADIPEDVANRYMEIINKGTARAMMGDTLLPLIDS